MSHHQNAIDWTQVAASGVRFAIIKASEGTAYIDPLYATTGAEAMASGIVVGAYHFARPDLHPFNPIPEADHFVDTAQVAPGNIVPVLDLERAGDLSATQLTDWVLQWLDEVTTRTGVRPMVYTSPNGWRDRMADTTAIADAGYTLLWIAHWNVASPTLPANDWQGNGWKIWQYSNCGDVPGIDGCVDLDYFNGLDFAPIVIPSPDTVAPVATIATPSGVTGPVTVSFSEIVRGVSSESLALRSTSSGVPVDAAITCASKAGQPVDCRTGNVIVAVLEPIDPLVPGQSYQAIANPDGTVSPIVDRGGNPAATTEADFAAPTQVEQSSPAINYTWRSVSSSNAFGGSYAMEHLEGATASFAFKGKTVTWFTVTGPTQGKASVWIDGHAKGTFNQYAPSMSFKVARLFPHLARGDHTITIRVLGMEGAPGAADTQVAVDAIQAGGKVIWSPELGGRGESEEHGRVRKCRRRGRPRTDDGDAGLLRHRGRLAYREGTASGTGTDLPRWLVAEDRGQLRERPRHGCSNDRRPRARRASAAYRRARRGSTRRARHPNIDRRLHGDPLTGDVNWAGKHRNVVRRHATPAFGRGP